jgi:transcriptional regulator with XRE-family HTH domain
VAKVAQPVREDDSASNPRSPKQVGRQLRNVRRKQGLTRAEVARSAGLTRRELAAYERGRVEIPESDLWCLAGSCGVDVAELLPQRDELRIDSSISTLAIGDSIRHLRTIDEPDGMLRQYLAMIYELRNLPPDATVPLREADLATLADALGGTPEAIEARLADVIGADRDEAARLRAMILPPRPLEAGDVAALPAGDGGSVESYAAGIESDLPPAVEDFFAGPRADDPFAAPPPLDPSPARSADPFAAGAAAPGEDPIATLPSDDPFAAFPAPDALDPSDLDPTTLPELPPLAEGADLGDAPLASIPPLRTDPFAAPGAENELTPSGYDSDEILVDLGEGTSDDEQLPPLVPDDSIWAVADPDDLDALDGSEILVDAAPGEAAAHAAEAAIESWVLAPAPAAVPDPSDTVVDEDVLALSEELGVVPPDVDDAMPRIAWRANGSDTPYGTEGPVEAPRLEFTRAGAGWQIGGMFPATAMADDGALALRRADTRWALSDLSAPGDVTAEAIVDVASGTGFGILFRAGLDGDDQLYGYSFDVDAIAGGGSYLLRQWEANRPHWRPLAQAQVVDPSRLVGRLAVTVSLRGDSLAVDVDGERVLVVPSLSHASIELGREPCRGDRLGIQAASTAEVTVDRLSAAQH